MSGIRLEGNTSGHVAEVDAGNNLLVTLSNTPQYMGGARMFSESDPGTITGEPYIKSPETSEDYKLRVGMDTLLDMETFNYAAQNTGKLFMRSTTMTFANVGGALTTNSGLVTTTNIGASLATNRYFGIYTAQPMYCEVNASVTAIPSVNTVLEFGMFIPGATTQFAPSDGCGFRWTSAGLFGVVNINGTEVTSPIFNFVPTLNINYHFTMTVYQEAVEFWINDVLYYEMSVPSGNGQPLQAATVPFHIRHAHTAAGAAGVAMQLKVTSYAVSQGDLQMARPWKEQCAGMDLHCSQIPAGAAVSGSTGLVPANNAVIATVIPSNTAATAVGLGGKTAWALTITSNNEFILFSYLNPAGTAVVSGRNLYIHGIKISSAVFTLLVAPVAGVNCIHFDLVYGASAVTGTLATTESASYVATTKRGRYIALGYQNFGTTAAAPAGTMGNDIVLSFNVPILVHPGEYIQIVERCINAAAGGLVYTSVAIDGHFE